MSIIKGNGPRIFLCSTYHSSKLDWDGEVTVYHDSTSGEFYFDLWNIGVTKKLRPWLFFWLKFKKVILSESWYLSKDSKTLHRVDSSLSKGSTWSLILINKNLKNNDWLCFWTTKICLPQTYFRMCYIHRQLIFCCDLVVEVDFRR